MRLNAMSDVSGYLPMSVGGRVNGAFGMERILAAAQPCARRRVAGDLAWRINPTTGTAVTPRKHAQTQKFVRVPLSLCERSP